MPRGQPSDHSNIGRRRRQAFEDPSTTYTEKRRLLLDAAARAFSSRGFSGARMDDIAAEADTDRATLYYYFANKQQLFRAVIIDAVEANVVRAEEIAAEDGSAREKLRRLVVALLDSYERHYPYLFVYVQEDMRRIPDDETPEGRRLQDLGARYEDALTDVIAAGLAAGEFRSPARPRLLAYTLLGAMNWSHRWFTPNGDLSGAEVGELMCDLFLGGLEP